MDRRTFMKAAGMAAVGATVLGAAKPAHAGAMSGKIKMAVKYGMIKEGKTPLEKLQLLKDIGFDGVEPGYGEVDIKELSKASEATGIKVHGIVRGWTFDDIEDCLDQAKFIGASSVLIVPRKVDEKMPYAQNYAETQVLMKKAGEYAAKQEILLLVENVWSQFLISPLEMARYIDEIDNPWVQSYFDIGNVMRYGWPDHWIPVLGSRIRKLDVKEFSLPKMNNEGLWKGFDVKIGDGSIDWAAVCRELGAIGYEGFATAEVDGGDRAYLADIKARMDKVFDM